MEHNNEFQIQLLLQIGSCSFIVNLILWHLCNEGLVFNNNLLAWIQHGNLTGFNILQDFVTFGVQESCKLLQFKHFLGTSCKIRNERITTNLPNSALWTKIKKFEWPNLYNVHKNALPPNKEPIFLSFALTH
jgi:hypothetical protein